jgi:hypothetical protein
MKSRQYQNNITTTFREQVIQGEHFIETPFDRSNIATYSVHKEKLEGSQFFVQVKKGERKANLSLEESLDASLMMLQSALYGTLEPGELKTHLKTTVLDKTACQELFDYIFDNKELIEDRIRQLRLLTGAFADLLQFCGSDDKIETRKKDL